MSEKYKDVEGAVPVDGDITPVTRQKIDQIDASKWPDMSINQLTDQRIVLSNRIATVRGWGGNTSVIEQLQRGLNQLDTLLREKAKEQGDTTHLI